MARYYMKEEIIEIYEGSRPLQIGYDQRSGQLFISEQAKEEVKQIAMTSRNDHELEQRLVGWARTHSQRLLN